MPYQLGIDTGGTYTDAALIDAQRKVIAKNKSLTTRHDLTIGIGNALEALPASALADVNLVALSTTLSTNSVVEGRGAPVSILLPGYNAQQIERSGLSEILEREMIIPLVGGHDAVGAELAPLDLETAARKIDAQQDSVSAFAVSALFATRNPAHEVALRELIIERTAKPVACGHELATSLGAPRRALTAALNARMILYIQTLIESVEAILNARGIHAPLMIVKGDGSLVNAQTALRQPVATVLSGPAASVIGACALSGQRDAIVVDMGGTTTDIAVVADGKPELCADGARIGDWQPMVEAIRVFSVGLGGDSEVRFKGALSLSGRRVVPMSLLAHQHPQTGVVARLEQQLRESPNPRHNRFALRLQRNDALLRQLNDIEMRAWDSLAEGPVELDPLSQSDRPRLRALARLERIGLAIYSGFTPSDATHVLGLSDHWDANAAHLAARIWARQMRRLYGCGNWADDDALAPCQQVFELVVREISQKLIEAGLHQHGKLRDSTARNLTQLLGGIILDDAQVDADVNNSAPPALFQIQFATRYPIVAVGGPARDYFPYVAKALRVELHQPDNAEIANAVGAALGAVVQTAHVTVTQPQHGVFYLFHSQQPMVFESLESALTHAESLAQCEATRLAEAAGACAIETRIERDDNHVRHDIDGELFVSATITAVARGRPDLARGGGG